jgi:NAD(P)-dependent dehydrogenase (short-subunit alcohol dehydrogenase family)
MFKNKIVFVTGAGKGIGKSLISSLLDQGSYIYALTKTKNSLNKFKNNKNIKIFYGDVSDIKLIKKIFFLSIQNKKIINSIVNNAGIRQRNKFEKISSNDLKNVFDTNFFSIFRLMQQFVIYQKKFKLKSSIINIGSIVGENGFAELSGYASTKGALKSFTKSFAVEFAKDKIRANIINPGFVKTSYYKKFKKKKLYKWTLDRTPLRRWGEISEIVNLIEFLISDKSSYITGASINIDGGWLSS